MRRDVIVGNYIRCEWGRYGGERGWKREENHCAGCDESINGEVVRGLERYSRSYVPNLDFEDDDA